MTYFGWDSSFMFHIKAFCVTYDYLWIWPETNRDYLFTKQDVRVKARVQILVLFSKSCNALSPLTQHHCQTLVIHSFSVFLWESSHLVFLAPPWWVWRSCVDNICWVLPVLTPFGEWQLSGSGLRWWQRWRPKIAMVNLSLLGSGNSHKCMWELRSCFQISVVT